jgi:hypothetical protein
LLHNLFAPIVFCQRLHNVPFSRKDAFLHGLPVDGQQLAMLFKETRLVVKARSFAFHLIVKLNHKESPATVSPNVVRVQNKVVCVGVADSCLVGHLESAVGLQCERVEQLEYASLHNHRNRELALNQEH